MLPRRHSARYRSLVGAILASSALGACSIVPAAGPSREAVITASARPIAPYLITPISNFTVEELQKFPGPSLYGKFGDYRGSLEQRVGVGDTLTVTIFEAAGGGLFSQAQTDKGSTGSHSAVLPAQVVQRDGSITVPYAGRVAVVGKTTPQIEKAIVDGLTGKAIEPQVVVSLTNNLATSVTLSGESVTGSRVPLTAAGDRILDVISQGGGIKTPANETFIELSRGSRTVRVPYQTLINTPRENIFARPDDTLTVIRYPLTFTAIGATGTNAVVPFNSTGISLEEAIGKSYGVLDGRADPEGIFVFRYEPISVVRNYPGLKPEQAALNLVPVVYLINMRDPRALFLARRFSMHDKDIVYISNSPLVELQKVVMVVNSVISPVLRGVALGNIIGNGSANTNLAVQASQAATSSAVVPTAPVVQ